MVVHYPEKRITNNYMRPLHIALILVGVGGLIYQFKSGIYGSPRKREALPPLNPHLPAVSPFIQTVAPTFAPKNIPVLVVPTLPKQTSVLPQTRSEKDALVIEWLQDGGIKNGIQKALFFEKFTKDMSEEEKEAIYQHVQFYILTEKKLPFGTKLYNQIHKITKKYKLSYK